MPLDGLRPDPALRAALARLPGRRLIFTNADAIHAERVLEQLELADLFEAVFHIGSADYRAQARIRSPSTRIDRAPTPSIRATTAFFEDRERNLDARRGAGHDHRAGRRPR